MHQKPHNPENGGHASSLTRTGRNAKFPFARGVAAAVAALGLTAMTASAASFTLPGWLNYEYYPGKDRPGVEAGTAGAPSTAGTVQGSDKSGYVSSFEAGNNFAENYANRIYGLFIPPATGNYVFFIASDDDSDLFLSTDADPANKHLIAQEAGWSGIRSWITVGGTSTASDKRSDTFATTAWPNAVVGATVITLTQGQQYYIEAVHHEGGGGDNVGVIYKLDTDPDPVDGAAPNLKGSNIAVTLASAPAAPNVTITQQPVGGTFYIGGSLALSVKVTSDSPFPISYQWRKGGTAIAGATGSSYSIGAPALTDSGNYDVQISYVGAGGTPSTLTSSVAAVDVQTSPFVTGFLKYEYFPGSDRPTVEAGGATASTGGTTQGSDKSGYVNIAESGTNFADNYANRFSGYFIPPTDGNYIFLVASDDDGDLFLSTDDQPANKKLIAQETGWSGVRNYNTQGGGSGVENKSSDTFAGTQWAGGAPAVITLTHGNHYYIEYVHHEGGGGDNVAVTYRLDSEDTALTADGTAPRLTGSVIGVSVPPQTISITTQPVATSVFAGTDASFSVAATTSGSFPIQYQWRKNGANITNATGTSYTIKAESGDAGNYDVVLTVPGGTATSSAAALTVKPGSITVAGKLKREYFPGADRVKLEQGNVTLPSVITELTSLETISNIADNYAERVSGLFKPAADGDYVFFVASDDDTDLFLSTDSTPAHKQLIAQELGWSAVREYTTVPGTDQTNAAQKRSDQFSPDAGATHPFAAGIHLLASNAYYIEAVHHEGTGGDNLAVTFKLAADPDPVSTDITVTPNTVGDPSLLTGPLISYITSPVTAASISTQPQNISSYEAQSVTLSVAVTTDAEITPTYQWRKGGNVITNATGSSFTIPFLATTDAGSYDVVVTIPNLAGAAGTLTSSAATISVFPAPLITGLLKYDFFPGAGKAALEAGTLGAPSTAGITVGGDKSGYITLAEAAVNVPGGNYASRISGFFIPPSDNDYVFFIAGDDASDLFLSTDDKPANKKLIAQEAGWSAYRRWNTPQGASTAADKRSDTFANTQWPGATVGATTIHLLKGQLYYIEADHEETGGGDNLGVTYKLATDADPSDADPFDASRLRGDAIGVKLVPPTLTSAPTMTAAYATTNDVTITFSQPLDHSTAIAGNFSFASTGAPAVTVGTPTAKEVLQGSTVVTVVTVPTTGFVPNTTYTITANNVKNTAGIAIAGGANTFIATTPVLTLNFNDLTLPDGVTGGSNGAGLAGTIVDASGPDGTAAFWLTEAVNSEQGALIIQDLVAGQPVTNFTAVFKLFIGHGSGNPADGMSFNFGNIDPSVTSAGEEGVGTISVDFDTYNNGNTGPGSNPEAPAFEVKLNGSIIGWVSLPQSAIVNDEWVDVVVALNPDNSITTIYNGVTYFDHLSLNSPVDLVSGATLASYAPISGAEFLIGGRTGGEHSQQSVDNFTISENAKTNPGGGGDHNVPSNITVTTTASNITITWNHAGKLQSSPTIGTNAVWTDVTGGGTSPATVSVGSGNLFYRVQAAP